MEIEQTRVWNFEIYLTGKTSSQAAVIWKQIIFFFYYYYFYNFLFLFFSKINKNFCLGKTFTGIGNPLTALLYFHCYPSKRHTSFLPFSNSPKSFFFYHPLFTNISGFLPDISGSNRVCAVKCQSSLVGQTMIMTV